MRSPAWWIAVVAAGCHAPAPPPLARPVVRDSPTAPGAPAARDAGSGVIADLDAYCAAALVPLRALADRRAAGQAADGDGAGSHEAPTCGLVGERPLAAPYRSAAILHVSNDDLAGGHCRAVVSTDAGWSVVGDDFECGTFGSRDRSRALTLVGATQVRAAAGDNGKLELRLHFSAQPFDSVPAPPTTNVMPDDIFDGGAEVDLDLACTVDHGAVTCTP